MSQTKAKAQFAFDGDTSAGELSIREGEIVTVLRQDVGEGWWEVLASNGKRGLAPGSYLQLVPNAVSQPPTSVRPRPPPPPFAPDTSNRTSVSAPSGANVNADSTYQNATSVTLRNVAPKPTNSDVGTMRQTANLASTQNQKLNAAWNAPQNETVTSTRSNSIVSSMSTATAKRSTAGGSQQTNDDSFEDDSFDEDSDYDRLNTEEQSRNGEAGETGSGSGTLGRPVSGIADIAKSGALRRGLCRAFVKLGGEAYLLGQFANIKVNDADRLQLTESAKGIIVWRTPAQTFTVTVSAPRKATKMRGLKSYTAYQLSATNSGLQVSRRYKQFDWLMSRLREKYVFVCVPPLPDKQITGLYEEEFVKSRMKKLQLWMNRITRHPLLMQSEILQHFVTCTDEKRWKQGKRKAEKEELQGGRMFNVIDLNGVQSTLALPMVPAGGKASFDLASAEHEMDTFDEQIRALDSACKQLSAVLHVSAKQQASAANRVAKPFAEAITQLARAGFDPNSGATRIVAGTEKMQAALNKTSATYYEIAKLYNEQAAKDVEPFIESLSEYHGLLTQLPELTLLHRNTIAAVHESTYQYNDEQKISEDDFKKICQRAQVITTVVEAEANFFNYEKVRDFKEMMRAYLQQQVNFHREVASKIESALKEFS